MERALYTEKQLAKKERNDAIVTSFKALKKKFPDSSLERIFTEIAKDYTITTAAIRNVCKARGLC